MTRIAKLKIGLCLLVWNEVDGIKKTVPKIPFDLFDDVFVMDGGSNDGTLEYLSQTQVRTIHQRRKGYNSAYLEAFNSTDADFLIFFHPKNTIDLKYINYCVELAKQGYDFVVASRNICGARNEEDDQLFKFRKWFVTALAVIAAAIWRREGNMIWDVLHGFRGIRIKPFLEMAPDPHGMTMDLEMVIRSYELCLSRVEFPVVEVRRKYNDTHFRAIPTGWELIKFLMLKLFRKESLRKVHRLD